MEKLQKLITQIYSVIGVFTLLKHLLPSVILQLFDRWFLKFQDRFFNTYYYFNVPQFRDCKSNVVYPSVKYYLSTIDAISSSQRLSVFRSKEFNKMEFCPIVGGEIEDSFQGMKAWWSHKVECFVDQDRNKSERQSYTLKIANKSRSLVVAYFHHIADLAAEFERLTRGRLLNSNETSTFWSSSVPMDHPSTFDSLALDPMTKDNIIRDLDQFKESKEFYRRVGRPWKRGYLLYGPPGTGKSSLVAAIANYMKYDVYDLELTNIPDNAGLRSILCEASNKSLIVIEDIDCSIPLMNRVQRKAGKANSHNGVTLSGMLNFADGLWSSSGEEKILIFTTNYKDRLDPALLRSGRMDMHILLSYCNFSVFKSLVANYLQIEDHPLFSKVEEMMEGERGTQITPAEMSEILITYLDDHDQAINAVISALNKNKTDPQLSKSSTSEIDFHTQDLDREISYHED